MTYADFIPIDGEISCFADENAAKNRSDIDTTYIVYGINPYCSIDWYKENADIGYYEGSDTSFNVEELETFDNGYTLYNVEVVASYGNETIKILTYTIDDYTLYISIHNPTDDTVVDFYRNLDVAPFIVQ